MTAAVKHMARKKPGTAGAATPAQPRNSQLRERFPARPAQAWWPGTAQDEGETLRWLTSPPFLPEVKATRAGRRRGTAKMLRWLSSFPGDTWQQRWEASSAEGHPGSSWVQLPLGWLRGKDLAASYDANDLSSGLLMLICGDVIRPGLAWMVTRAHKHLAPVMEAVRDPGGFARLRELAESGPTASSADARLAATRAAEHIAPLDWRFGDPLVLLRDLSPERFGLVLVAPPMAMRGQVAPEPDDPRGRVEIADLVLWRAARAVGDHGAVLFHTPDNFFWARSRRNLWAGFAERGLHPRAVISVDPAMAPSWSIATSLVLFTAEARDQLFVGRLERGTSVAALVRNLVAERTDDDPQLGVLTPAESFRGWRPLVLEQELGRMFGSSELRPLADLGRIRWLELRPDVPYDPPANCVFVPTLGFGNVSTVPPDLTGKRGYKLLEVELDPEVAQAEYVAGLLSSPPGRQLRESVSTGTGGLHLSATGAQVIRLPVPPVSVQVQTVRSAAQLASMEATIARLREQLWRRPQDAVAVLAQLEASAKADPVRRWLDTLPYPLASVLQRFSAQRDPKDRLEGLLHFYEATAQFGCAVLLSILWADPDLLAVARPEIAPVVGRRADLFDRAEFGRWTRLGRTLAQAIGHISEERELQGRLREAAGPAAVLMAQLAGERIWQVLDQARANRNRRAHAGVLPLAEVESRIATLEVLLSDAEQALGSGFEDIDLARVDQGRFIGGLHVYLQAQRLRGSPGFFDEFELKTRVNLESGHVAFVGRDVDISSVLMLVPLVRIGGTEEISRNACYFFNERLGEGRFRYVSYHFEDQPWIEVREPELQQLLVGLTAP